MSNDLIVLTAGYLCSLSVLVDIARCARDTCVHPVIQSISIPTPEKQFTSCFIAAVVGSCAMNQRCMSVGVAKKHFVKTVNGITKWTL